MRIVGVILFLLMFPALTHAARININTADVATLDSLPGIGEAKATSIIDYRNQNGPFETIEDIKKVSGIGDAIFNNIKDLISVADEVVEPPPTPPPDPGSPPTESPPAPPENVPPETPTLVNINTADKALLETLVGIGATKAADIIAYREAHGQFLTIEDIQNVKGIGPSTFANIKAFITVGEVSPPSPPPLDTGEPATSQAPNSQPAGLININTADASLLDSLPGIGPAKAADIIEYRKQNGPFKTIEEIQNVKGIGPSTFANIKLLITVGSVAKSLPKPEIETLTQKTEALQQPLGTTTSYQKVQAVEQVTSVKKTTERHANAVIAPTAATKLAAVGAAIQPENVVLPVSDKENTNNPLFSPWAIGLVVVVIIAAGAFILL